MPNNNKTENQTKAGLLKKNGDDAPNAEETENLTKSDETTPKISKEKAGDRQNDKPIH